MENEPPPNPPNPPKPQPQQHTLTLTINYYTIYVLCCSVIVVYLMVLAKVAVGLKRFERICLILSLLLVS